MKAKNQMLDKIKQQAELKYSMLFHRRVMMLLQMCQDAAVIASNEAYGVEGDKVLEFVEAFRANLNEIAGLMNEDMKDDEEFVYTKEKLDRRLKEICGDAFDCWEVRYRDDEQN